MARSIELSLFPALVLLLVACGNAPSKKATLEIITRDVKEDATCVLDPALVQRFKMQYTTKAACVPKENADKLPACVGALVDAGLTKEKTPEYMREWPDEVAMASLRDIPAFERRARSLLYSGCYELSSDLREGKFPCGTAKAKQILKIVEDGKDEASVRYERDFAASPSLERIEQACGKVTKPPVENTVSIARGESGWAVPSAKTDVPSFLPPPGSKSYH